MGLLGVSLLLLLIIFLLGVFTAGSFFASIPIFGDILALPFQALGFIPTQFWIGFVMLGILAYFLSGNNNGGRGGGGKATGAALVGAGLGASKKFLEGVDEDQNHNGPEIPDKDDETELKFDPLDEEKIEDEILELISHIEEKKKKEKNELEGKKKAINLLKDSFKKLKNNEVLLTAIVAAYKANEGQEVGSQALATAIQRQLDKANKNYTISHIADEAENIEAIWREVAQAEMILEQSIEEELDDSGTEIEIEKIRKTREKYEKGIREIKRHR